MAWRNENGGAIIPHLSVQQIMLRRHNTLPGMVFGQSSTDGRPGDAWSGVVRPGSASLSRGGDEHPGGLPDVRSGDRRPAAHHQVAVNDGKLILHSAQARKLLKRIKDLRPPPAKTVDDINQWVEAARGAYEQGQNVLANLDRLAEEVAKRQAK